MVTALRKFAGTCPPEPILKQFTYDQLNRITGMSTYTGSDIVASNAWTNASSDGAYSTAYSYDGNGNLDTLIRQGKSGLLNMDHLIYHYEKEAGTGKLLSNRLYHVKDDAGATSGYDDDLEILTNAPGSNLSTTGNYGYDAIGNLIRDDAEGIQDIEWDVYGKILAIDKASDDDLSFAYDAIPIAQTPAQIHRDQKTHRRREPRGYRPRHHLLRARRHRQPHRPLPPPPRQQRIRLPTQRICPLRQRPPRPAAM